MRHFLGYCGLALSLAFGIGCGGTDATAPGGSGGAGGSGTTTGATGGGGSTSSTTQSGVEGTVVINEIMYDPKQSSDDAGEWIELYNPGGEPVVLDEHKLRDDFGNKHVITSLTIPPGAYYVLAKSGDKALNGGVEADYVYGDDFNLANAGDMVVIETLDGAVLDQVEYGSAAPWPVQTPGVSIELRAEDDDNTDPANWQLAVKTFGKGDRGTPGAKNGGELPTYEIDESVVGWHNPELKASLHFAPHDDLESHVLAHLALAQKQIRLAFFNIRLGAVRKLLEQKVKDGVDVHVLLDKKQQDLDYNTMGEELVKAGVKTTLVDNTLAVDATMHNKFAVLDGGLVMTGSANYSTTALNVSDEDLVTFEDAALAARYLSEFDEVVAAGDVKSTPYAGAEKLKVWMGPEDSLPYKVKSLIDGAKQSVVVAMFQLNTDMLVDALIAAKDRGVTVVVILDTVQADDPNALADEALDGAGVNVIKVQNKGNMVAEMHSKFVVVDHQTLAMGSYNWTNLGSFYNDENLMIISDPHLAARAEGKLADLLNDYQAPPAAGLGLTTGPQAVTFQVTNVTLGPGVTLRISGEKGGPFATPIELTDGSLTANIEAGTRVVYRYEIVHDDIPLVKESGTHAFTVPYAPGPFTVKDAFKK